MSKYYEQGAIHNDHSQNVNIEVHSTEELGSVLRQLFGDDRVVEDAEYIEIKE